MNSKRKLILIRGPICSGKSTTVRFLAEKIGNCSIIDQDCLKRAIDGDHSSSWRDKIAFDTTIFMVSQIMKKGRIIIADIHSSVKRQYECYKKLAKENDYQLYSFLLYPPLEVCLSRNRTRLIPDVKYKITPGEIEKYWSKVYQVKNEICFDTSNLSVSNVSEKIIKIVLG